MTYSELGKSVSLIRHILNPEHIFHQYTEVGSHPEHEFGGWIRFVSLDPADGSSVVTGRIGEILLADVFRFTKFF